MSIKAMVYVWETSFTGAQKLMLLAIADRCDDNGECFPGVERLALKCGVGKRSAQKIIVKLEEAGELAVQVGGGIETNSGHTNRYYMKKYRDTLDLDTTELPKRNIQTNTPTKQGVSKVTGLGVSKVTPNTTEYPSDIKSTPLPPAGGMVTEAHAPKASTPNKPSEPPELVAMKYAVCKHLKAYGKPGKQVAMLLLNLHKGKAAEYNVGGEAFSPAAVERFGLWWDKGHWDKQTRKPLTRPRNMGSVQSYFLMWRAELAEQALIAAAPEPVYEDLGPVDIFKESIFDKPAPTRNEVAW